MTPPVSPRDREVLLSYTEVALARLPLADLLRLKGIDPSQPYAQHDCPTLGGHVYRQELPAPSTRQGEAP